MSFLKKIRARLSGLWFKSVRRQLILGIALVHAVLMSVFVLDMVGRQKAFLHQESLGRAEALAQTLAANSLSWLMAADLVGLEEIVETLRIFPGIKYAMVLDTQGRVLAHTDSKLVGLYLADKPSLGLLKGETSLRRLAVNSEIIDLAVPVTNAGSLSGWARVCLDQSEQQAALARVTQSGALYVLLAILIGTLMAVIIAKRLTAGLFGLMRVSSRVQAGERGILADESRSDEVGVLCRDFNRMLAAVQATENSLSQSLEWKRTILDTSAAAIMVVDGQGLIREVNAVFADMFELSQPEALGLHESLLHPSEADYRDFTTLTAEHMQKSGQVDLERRLRRQDGKVLWCKVSGRAIDPEHLSRGVIWLIIDISERKKAENALRESEQRFRSISDFTFDWEYWLAPDGSFLWVSPSCERVTGYTAQEFMEDQGLFLDITHPLDHDLVARHMAESLGPTELGPCSFDYRIINRNHELVWVNHCCRRIQGLEGKNLGRRGCMRDVSQSKRAEAELIAAKERAEAASQAKDNFLATMSHEVRTPLNGIMGMLQLVRESGLDAKDDKLLGIALESSRKLLTILSDILDIARVQSGRAELCFEEVRPWRLLDSVAEIFREDLSAKQLRLNLCIDPKTPECVFTDEGRLRQILFNLIGNAVKFTDKGAIGLALSALPIRPGPGRMRLLFVVSDSGIGIDPDKLDYVFESFSQGDSRSFSRRYAGLGLGLSIVKRFVELLGGNICLESLPDVGSTFYFTIEVGLPEVSCPEVSLELAETRPHNPAGSLSLILAEDDRVNQITARMMLEGLGHRVSLASDGLEVLQLLEQEDFDLVLMDVQMPGLDGIETTRAIRELDSGRAKIPILAVTAHDMLGDREKFLSLGMDGFLAKPFLKSDLQKAISLTLAARTLLDKPGRCL